MSIICQILPYLFIIKLNFSYQTILDSQLSSKQLNYMSVETLNKRNIQILQYNNTIKMGQCVSNKEIIRDKSTNNSKERVFNIKDFKFIKLIGKGGFSKVWKVQEKKSGNIYAIKVMDKAKIIAKKSVKAVIQERKILTRLSQAGINFIANIRGSFQDNSKLYLLMDYLQGNTLRHHMNCGVKLSQTQIRLLVMALVKTFQFLYTNKVIHGDLKPENILFDKEGVPFLTDFGAASYNQKDNSDYNSGTLGYMAPQVMQYQSHNFSADYYAIGVITFQLLLHKRPFVSHNKEELLKQIRKKPVNIENFPQLSTINPLAQDFIINLLQRKPQNRLGYSKGIRQLLSHPWLDLELSGINFLDQLSNINNIFQSKMDSVQLTDQSDKSAQTQQNIHRYEDILDLDYVQEMFQGFNFILPPENNIVEMKVRKSSFEMIERLQSNSNVKRLLDMK